MENISFNHEATHDHEAGLMPAAAPQESDNVTIVLSLHIGIHYVRQFAVRLRR